MIIRMTKIDQIVETAEIVSKSQEKIAKPTNLLVTVVQITEEIKEMKEVSQRRNQDLVTVMKIEEM